MSGLKLNGSLAIARYIDRSIIFLTARRLRSLSFSFSLLSRFRLARRRGRCHASVSTSSLRVGGHFTLWWRVKSGADVVRLKRRYTPSGNSLSTVIVDRLRHLFDACSRVSKERRFLLALLTADTPISASRAF